LLSSYATRGQSLPCVYPSALPGGVPAEVHDARDSARALDIAREVLATVRTRLA
jgi:hypothetical protein